MLELKNISKQFGQKTIFDGFNLTVQDGEVLSLVGPSGGGKTTLLRMLAGLESIDSGQVFYNGEDVGIDHLENRNLLGFVFQDFQLFPHLTVLDNLTLSPTITMGKQKADAKEKGFGFTGTFRIKRTCPSLSLFVIWRSKTTGCFGESHDD